MVTIIQTTMAMTIRKGEDWGELRPLPDHGVIVTTDAEACAIVTKARHLEQPIPSIGLLGGDLYRTLGGTGDKTRLYSEQAVSFTCDLGVATFNGQKHYFVAHLVARRQWWRGEAVVAMNAAWLNSWNTGPKAHPGDALLDVYEAKVPLRQRAMVKARLPLGAHLPHPDIIGRRANTFDITLTRKLPIYLDGIRHPSTDHLNISLEPDALTIFV